MVGLGVCVAAWVGDVQGGYRGQMPGSASVSPGAMARMSTPGPNSLAGCSMALSRGGRSGLLLSTAKGTGRAGDVPWCFISPIFMPSWSMAP